MTALPRRLLLRRALGRTRIGGALKRRRRRRPIEWPTLTRRPVGHEPVRNVLLVSHVDFTGNSAFHVHAIAEGLLANGLSPAIAIPGDAGGLADVTPPAFPVRTYRDVLEGGTIFPDGRPLDLVHAFSPRLHVQGLVASVAAPYVAHLEDNDLELPDRPIPRAALDAFLTCANGMTAVVETLLEFKPADVPAVVFWPGFDRDVLQPARSRHDVRSELDVGDDDVVLVYPGNVTEANVADVRELYGAVELLQSSIGRRVILVRTGWTFVRSSDLGGRSRSVVDLGWVPRRRVPELLAAADVLVQPGRGGRFDDYRFPSKLPEFLASGRPVVLPQSNIGRYLRDGVEAILLTAGDADEIATAVRKLVDDPELRDRVGAAGRGFAVEHLSWETAVARITRLYREIERANWH